VNLSRTDGMVGWICLVLFGVSGLCGDIAPYTLMAPHGPRQTRWPDSSERAARISELLGEPCGASRDYLTVKKT
jgi:hypothetical protein